MAGGSVAYRRKKVLRPPICVTVGIRHPLAAREWGVRAGWARGRAGRGRDTPARRGAEPRTHRHEFASVDCIN